MRLLTVFHLQVLLNADSLEGASPSGRQQGQGRRCVDDLRLHHVVAFALGRDGRSPRGKDVLQPVNSCAVGQRYDEAVSQLSRFITYFKDRPKDPRGERHRKPPTMPMPWGQRPVK